MRDERGGVLVFALLMLPLLLLLFAYLGDLAAETVVQTQLHYALESALDDAAQQVDPLAASHNCIVLDAPQATQAFESGLMAALKSPGPAQGGVPNWDFYPGWNLALFQGPLVVDGFQVYNTNYLVQNSNGTYSCLTTSALGTTTPWGTVLDRPMVYADLKATVILPTGSTQTLDVFADVGANQAN